MTESDKEADSEALDSLSQLATVVLHGVEFISEGVNHRLVLTAMVLAAYRYADLQRDCCMAEGPSVLVAETLSMIVRADERTKQA